MPSATLLDTCMNICMSKHRFIEDVGSLEYMQIKPLLQRITSAEQLHRIEENSPQIKGEDKELWQKFIARDFPGWGKKNYEPKNASKWYEVYCKYKKEQEAELARDSEILREAMSTLKRKREEKVSKIVDLRALPKVPRDPGMMSHNGGVPTGKKSTPKSTSSSVLSWTAGSKTKMTDGKSVMGRAFKEAKSMGQMSKLSKPTHQLSGRIGQVTKAPVAMVKEHKTAKQPQSLKILSGKKGDILISKPLIGVGRNTELEDREQRLRKAMKGKTASKRSADGSVKVTLCSFSDDEEDSLEDSVEELFEDKKQQSSKAQAQINPAISKVSAAPAIKKPSDMMSSILGVKAKVYPASSPPAGSKVTPPPTNQSPGANPLKRSSPESTPSPTDRCLKLISPEPVKRLKLMPKKKEVDIFNRRPTKPRSR